MTESNLCPRCFGGVPSNGDRGKYPGALSRTDNQTEICEWCGLLEALEAFTFGRGIMPQSEWWINREKGAV